MGLPAAYDMAAIAMDHPLPISGQTPADHALNDPLARLAVHVGDITALPLNLGVDAIANAANESLLGGGGVDGAIHEAAGRGELVAYNREHHPAGCPTGLAKHSPAFALENKGIRHILHAVGPVWPTPPPESESSATYAMPGAPIDNTAKLGYTHADNLLASCYVQLFALAVKHDIQHLAIPAVSTGVFRFPKPRAARIAFGHAHGHLLRNELPQRITFVCFNDEDATHYHRAINTRGEWMANRGRV
ncbi:macro domain-containing protein [Phycisphaeraceae bacterium D3-23]